MCPLWIDHTCETANTMTSLCYAVVIINCAMTMHFDFIMFIFNYKGKFLGSQQLRIWISI